MSVSIIGGRSRARRRNQRTTGQRTRPAAPTPINIVGAAFAGGELTVTFDQPVMLSGVPEYRAVDGNQSVSATSAERVSPTSVRLTYPAGTGAGGVVVPADDPAVTNATGGRVNGGTISLAAQAAAGESTPALKAA